MTDISPELRTAMENSPFAHRLGLRLLELSPGYARVSVSLDPEHVNFLGGVDGGLVMSLADYAFACSCNSLGKTRVAIQFSTNFLSPPNTGDELVAEAITTHDGKTIALTEISVRGENNRVLAKATGTAFTIPNPNPQAG